MSLTTFATETFTTFADLKRKPAIDKGQVLRTLAFFIAFAMTLAFVAHRNDAVASQPIVSQVLAR